RRSHVRPRRLRADGPRGAAAPRRGRDRRRDGAARGPHRPGRGDADVGPAAVGPRGVPPAAGAVAVARVLALVPDLLFGSRVKAALAQSGHDPELIARAGELRERLAGGDVDVLVIDLADPDLDGVGILSGLAADGTS